MISEDLKIDTSENKEFELLPEDVYQVEIVDVNEVIRNKYQSTEQETALRFKFKILEGKYKNRLLFKTISPKWNEGFEEGQPSNLYVLMTTLGWKGGVPTAQDVNNLIGKQLRVLVKIKKGKKGEYNAIEEFIKTNKLVEKEKEEDDAPTIDDIEDIDLNE